MSSALYLLLHTQASGLVAEECDNLPPNGFVASANPLVTEFLAFLFHIDQAWEFLEQNSTVQESRLTHSLREICVPVSASQKTSVQHCKPSVMSFHHPMMWFLGPSVTRQAHMCACHLLWGTALPQGQLIMWLCIQTPRVGNLKVWGGVWQGGLRFQQKKPCCKKG